MWPMCVISKAFGVIRFNGNKFDKQADIADTRETVLSVFEPCRIFAETQKSDKKNFSIVPSSRYFLEMFAQYPE